MFSTISPLSLQSLKTEIRDVVNLEGNCGRQVRRVLERLFPNGTATVTLQLADVHPVQFGYRCAKLLEIAAYADEIAKHPTDPAYVASFKVQNVDPTRNTVDLVVTLENIPENVKGRQCLLGMAYEGVHQLWHHVEYRDTLEVDTVLAIALGFDDPDESNAQARANGLAMFDKLMAGDYSELADTPGLLLHWAEVQKPDVAAATDAWEAEQDRQALTQSLLYGAPHDWQALHI